MSIVRTLIGNIKGPAGATGATGATGAAGANGADGAAATISVGTVSTTAYGNPAEVTNTGTSSAAVFDFVIPQGQPGEEVTDMSGLTLGTMTTQTAQYPTPQIGDNGATLWGKVVKYFSDLRTAIGTKVNLSAVTTSLNTTEEGFVLDARAGKTLNDTLNLQHSTLASGNLNDCTSIGLYYLSAANSYTNMPSGITYGLMAVWRSHPSHTVIEQTVYHRDGTLFRTSTNSGGAWTDWSRYATMTNINAINSKLDGVFLKTLRQPSTSTTDTFTSTAASARHVLICIDSSDPRCGAWFVFSTAQNVVGYKEIVGSSGLSVSASTNKFVVTHGNGTPYYLDICIDVGGTFLTIS